MKIVIRAGGVGTRLWPISRQNNPKQFHPLINNKSLIRNTVDRVKPLLENQGDFFISVSQQMVEKLKKEIPELLNENIIIEPESRNTGPAICLESCVLAKRFGEDTVVASLPSDDYIQNKKAFCEMLREAEKFLERNPEYIVTPGVKPTYPDPGYSYMRIGMRMDADDDANIFQVAEWVEKPTLSQCKKLIQSGKYFYHTGMYVWKLKTILDLFRKFQPEIYKVCSELVLKCSFDQFLKVKKWHLQKYANLKKMTIETAITLKAPKIAVIISDKIGWSDLGKWHIIARILSSNKSDNIIKGKVLALDTKNCLIYGLDNRLIATVGLDDMIIVQTDDAILICPKDRSDEVKKIVEELEKRGMKEYL
jgi:mannose-1-phosphate guanylyltransferase